MNSIQDKHLLSANHELFQHFQLLLCCLEFVLRQTPSFLLHVPYDSIRFGCYSYEQMTMLQKLALDFDVSVDETLELQRESTESYFQSLLNADGELDSERLCSDYLMSYQKDGDINEIDFLLKDSYLHPLLLKRVVNLPYQHCHSMLHEPMTPVRMAVSTIQQFQQNFENLPDCPSEKLITYFKKCINDPSDTINKIINNLKDKFIKEYQFTKLAQMRFIFGVKLFYRVLEVIILNETGHLPPPVLSTLLNKESFHTSLLACALEVVLITYSPTWSHHNIKTTEEPFFFPWILNIFSLQPYEFYKVIESFIKAEPRLSTDVIKHLQYIETRVLESLAWTENSALFEFFNDCEVGQKTPPLSGSPDKSHENSGKNAVDLYLSPVRPQSVPSTSQSQQKTMPTEPVINEIGNRLSLQFKSQSLAHFLKRVLRLGFSRLSKLCSDLDISRELQHKIWTCFEYCITKMPHLLKNRHIDQIIMCCIYSICKVSDSEIKFKFIVNEYKSLPHAKQEIFRYVYIEDNKYESIINFYNSIFMVNLKKYILNFHPNKDKQHLSPMPRHSPSYCLQGRKNFLISPLKDSFKTPGSPGQMTPSTRLLYSFGDSIGSSEKLKDINETVKKFGPARAKKRLNMDDVEITSASKAKRQLCNS
ncbi:Retinoblastoma-associated protein [Bulinus truncatus]|nr:Retinoblastoma-associated protein [Bulinus truncatus]